MLDSTRWMRIYVIELVWDELPILRYAGGDRSLGYETTRWKLLRIFVLRVTRNLTRRT
jgi:hypothetical protein